MAGSSIGKLSVQIGGSADEFNKMISGAEKRILGFSSKATQWPNAMMGAFGKVSNASIRGLDDIAKSASQLVEMLPGGKVLSMGLGLDQGVTGWVESGERGLTKMRDLRREAERFGISGGFLRAFQITGGKDADIATNVIDKATDALAKLRRGDPELNKSLMPFLSGKQLKTDSPEAFLKSVADIYKNIGDQVTRLDFLGNITGNKLADDAHYFFSGGKSKIEANMGLVAEKNLYDADIARMGDAKAATDRMIGILQEQIDAKNSIHALASSLVERDYMEGKFGKFEKWGRQLRVWLDPGAAQRRTDHDKSRFPAGMYPAEGGLKLTPEDAMKRVEGERLATVAKTAAELADEMERQNAILNKSPWEAHVLKLQKAGAAQDILNRIVKAGQIQDLDALNQSVKSPAEKYADEVARIQRITGPNKMGLAGLAKEKAFADAFGTNAAIAQAKQQSATYSPNGPLSAGSQELLSAINEYVVSDEDPSIEQLVNLAEQNLTVQRAQEAKLAEINRRLMDRKQRRDNGQDIDPW